VADITVSSEDLTMLLTLRELSLLLMRRIDRNYRFIIGFNLGLILLGAFGVIPPTTSALLHNSSTILLSLDSMRDLLQ
jgi:cation transport ATPase